MVMREFASSLRFGTVAFLVCYAVLCTQTHAPVEALDDTHQGGMGANEGKTVEMPRLSLSMFFGFRAWDLDAGLSVKGLGHAT